MENQQTLAAPAEFKGIGLHSGHTVRMRCLPAEPSSGIRLRRSDIEDAQPFPATLASLKADALQRQTTLAGPCEATVATVEHLLSACCGLSIHNLLVEIDGPEVPLFDGSAQEYVDRFRAVGLSDQGKPVEYVGFDRPLTMTDGEAEITYLPGERFRATYFADYDSEVTGTQAAHYHTGTDYAAEIAPARTFVFVHEIEALRQANLIKGGSLDNALVIGDQDYINGPPRFDNELSRHKLLDLMGDLMLLGRRLKGHVMAYKSGHRSHVAFAQLLEKRLAS